MKSFFVLLCLLLFVTILPAQDVIVTNGGDALKVWSVEVSNTAVFYRETDVPEAPIKRIDKKDVLMIKYQDGRKIILEENKEQTSSAALPAGEATEIKLNEDFINIIKSNKVEYIGPESTKEAGMLFCQYLPKNSSKMADQNVSFYVITEATAYFNGNKDKPRPREMQIFIAVKNHTRGMLYVDLGNTFLIRGGQSYAYYIPTMTSQSTSTHTGVGVNVGAVSGVLGTLANGINVGFGSSQTNTTTVMSQRIIAIPPMTEKKIEAPTTLFPLGEANLLSGDFRYAGGYRDLSLFLDEGEMLKIGESREADEKFGIAPFGIVVTYASDEQISNPQVLNADYSVQHVVGTKSVRNEIKYFDVESVSRNYTNTAHVYVRQRKK